MKAITVLMAALFLVACEKPAADAQAIQGSDKVQIPTIPNFGGVPRNSAPQVPSGGQTNPSYANPFERLHIPYSGNQPDPVLNPNSSADIQHTNPHYGDPGSQGNQNPHYGTPGPQDNQIPHYGDPIPQENIRRAIPTPGVIQKGTIYSNEEVSEIQKQLDLANEKIKKQAELIRLLEIKIEQLEAKKD